MESIKNLVEYLGGQVVLNDPDSLIASFSRRLAADKFVAQLDSSGYNWEPITARSVRVFNPK